MSNRGMLIYFCVKMGAGKSTKSKSVAIERNAVLISEGEWLAKLYPDKITTFDDYIKFSALLRPLVKSYVKNILRTGSNVVMDFPAYTKRQREWYNKLSIEAESEADSFTLRSSVYAIPVYKQFGFIESGEIDTKDGISFLPMELRTERYE